MPAVDKEYNTSPGMLGPFTGGAAVTPHNTTELAFVTRGLFVGTGGTTLTVTMQDGADIVFTNVPDGTLLPIRAKIVKDTGTDAEDIVALW